MLLFLDSRHIYRYSEQARQSREADCSHTECVRVMAELGPCGTGLSYEELTLRGLGEIGVSGLHYVISCDC